MFQNFKRDLNFAYILYNLCENELLPRSKFPLQKIPVEELVNKCDNFQGTRSSVTTPSRRSQEPIKSTAHPQIF